MPPTMPPPFRHRPALPSPPNLWPPSPKQTDSGIRTLYDLSKGITLFGVFVPLVTFNGVWYKIVFGVTAGLGFFVAAWYLEGRHGSAL